MRLAVAAIAIFAMSAGACARVVLHTEQSLDGRHQVRVFERGAKQYVELNGREEGYRAVGIEGVQFSPDGEHLAFPALTETGWTVVLDGAKSPERWDAIGELAFSPDGAHLAYAAVRAHAWSIVQDGSVGTNFAAVQRGSLTFGACGGRFGYIARDHRGWRAVIDGVPGTPYEGLRALEFSGDGRRYGFIAAREGAAIPVIDGVERPSGDEVAHLSFGGGRSAYFLRRGAVWRAVIDGVESADYDMVASLMFSTRGEHVAYAARSGKKWFVVDDGVESAAFDRLDAMCFAGERLAYTARSGDRWHASDGGEHAKISALTCTRGAIAYVAEDEGAQRVIIRGEPQPEYAAITALSLSRDGEHHLYSAHTGAKTLIVHDGKETALDRAMNVELVLSADGEHWASLVAALAERKVWVVVDGERQVLLDLDQLIERGLQKRSFDHDEIRARLAADLIHR